MRPILLALPLLLGGCCCGLGGGGGSSTSIGDRISEKASEKLGEAILEKTYEASTGHDMDVSGAGTKFVVETDDGTITTYVDGTIPDGLPCALPGGAKIEAATRLDPKDPAKNPVIWGVTYSTTGTWEAESTYWMTESVKCGYTPSSTRAEIAAAMKEAAAAGADVSGMDPGTGTGEMITLAGSDPSKKGGIVIDGSTPGTTTVTLSLQH